MNRRNGRSSAEAIRNVQTVYMPSGKTAPQYERVVAQREPAVDVPPYPQDQQHRDPPGSSSPVEHGEALQEWEQ